MVRYAHLLGKDVELVYSLGRSLPGLLAGLREKHMECRAGQKERSFGPRFAGTELFACGVLLGCSDEFILMEQRADQFGSIPRFALTIPHSWILRLGEDDRESRIPATQRRVEG